MIVKRAQRRMSFAFKFQILSFSSTAAERCHLGLENCLHSTLNSYWTDIVPHIKNSEVFLCCCDWNFLSLLVLCRCFTVGLWLKWIWNFFIVLVLCIPYCSCCWRGRWWWRVWQFFRWDFVSFDISLYFQSVEWKGSRKKHAKNFIIIIFISFSQRRNSFLPNNFMAEREFHTFHRAPLMCLYFSRKVVNRVTLILISPVFPFLTLFKLIYWAVSRRFKEQSAKQFKTYFVFLMSLWSLPTLFPS